MTSGSQVTRCKLITEHAEVMNHTCHLRLKSLQRRCQLEVQLNLLLVWVIAEQLLPIQRWNTLQQMAKWHNRQECSPEWCETNHESYQLLRKVLRMMILQSVH